MEIKQLLNQIAPLSDIVLNDLMGQLVFIEYPKNYFLLKEGRVCRHLWILVSGSSKYFVVNKSGKLMNVWFSFETDFITNIYSFSSQTPSRENIQLTEDSSIFYIGYDQIHALLDKHHSFALWYISLLKKMYIPLVEERVFDLQFLSAKERYDKLLLTHPDISQRISLGNIASYLNISPETLSRIRSKRS